MGWGPAARELWEMLAFKPPGSICDLGSQEMSYIEDGQQIHRESARDWLEAQGFKYECVDMDGKFGAVQLNLNTARAESMGHGFDIVANHGTSEHVFDQANVFRFMHDLTLGGGGMIHAVPTPRFGPRHGFYFYDETIFEDLAHANGYKIVHMHRRSEPYEIILVAFAKLHESPFIDPIQGLYRR